jgi:hypothetical protein
MYLYTGDLYSSVNQPTIHRKEKEEEDMMKEGE